MLQINLWKQPRTWMLFKNINGFKQWILKRMFLISKANLKHSILNLSINQEKNELKRRRIIKKSCILKDRLSGTLPNKWHPKVVHRMKRCIYSLLIPPPVSQGQEGFHLTAVYSGLRSTAPSSPRVPKRSKWRAGKKILF